MVRFDDYKPLPGKQSGYGGAKIAYVDELRWIPVPDADPAPLMRGAPGARDTVLRMGVCAASVQPR